MKSETMTPAERERFVYFSHEMAPDEFARYFRMQDIGQQLPFYEFERAASEASAEADILNDKPGWQTAYERILSEMVERNMPRMHRRGFDIQLSRRQRVSAAAVDAYDIRLPEGYIREGEFYVHQP